MLVKNIIDEDFINYKKPSMFIGTCYCDWKCPKEQNIDIAICQNQPLCKQKNIDMPIEAIFDRYIKNSITKAVCFGGLEPFLQFEDVYNLIKYFRDSGCSDDVVIYTGYYEYETQEQIVQLQQFPNIVIKFGRFIPNQNPHFDPVLGINLISDNQHAKKIS